MAKEEHIELEGRIVHAGSGGVFKVECEGEHVVTATLGGKLRKNRIRVVLGDEVTVAVSPYDPTRGRIIFRKK